MGRQFKFTTDEGRASVVYSTSTGKGGLYSPNDYVFNSTIDSARNTNIEEQSEEELSQQPAITNTTSIINRNIDELYEEDINNAFDSTAVQPTNYEVLAGVQQQKKSVPSSSSLNSSENSSLCHTSNNTGNMQMYASIQTPGPVPVLKKYTKHDNGSSENSLIEEERTLLIDNDYYANENRQQSEEENITNTWENVLDSGSIISTTYKRECYTLVTNSIPLVFTFVLQNSLFLASVFSVSHLGTKELGGVTLGSMTANITGFAAIQGLCTCLDTLCSQAYGAEKYHLVGIYFQRCCIISLILFLPILFTWFFWSEQLLCLFIPERELCVLAAKYLQIVAFGLPAFILFESGKRFLQCQGIFHASTIILLFCAPLNAIMNYVLVWNKTIGIGYLGAPLSVVINYWLMCIGLITYTIFTKHKVNPMKCWGGLIKFNQVFKNWNKIFNLAIPGIVMVEAEFLGFELLTVFASYLGEAELAAQSIVSTVASLAYQVPFSISISTSTRVANFIGAKLWENCIRTCKISLLLSFAASIVNMTIIAVFRNGIADMFSTDSQVISIVSKTLLILSAMEIFDAFNACTAGCLRGQGQQKIGGIINVAAFYLIGVPLAYFLTFKWKMGVEGLWLGVMAGLMFMSFAQCYAVFNCNWKSIISRAESRNED
ncbi:related to Ethionine resistance-conferring protein 1 [Saccharomycodes ludwigii]|uniref:Related to Ethionine resistance-conferring protein 1 n=1 Tax=Saccharomycodes ludwigii TaxID=36035 RepID=A0A376BAL1_9ASCO|nr:hypothetical protein SCDLUD_004832 [Saccharomycodes ludwigii]KAH3899389.1 hypothetical protein SCDLUD_004832 [Saccharomycodes ludwigii]SSD61584.1 related to Ethionine resistance-conferring protein 1 [Saccharomycodes ludwigii]